MTAVLRWRLRDVETGDTWTMPINPNQMSSPTRGRNISTVYGTRKGPHRLRSFQTPTDAAEWTFGGVIRTEQHYLDLVEWAKKDRKVRITDHLGRTFEVLMEALDAVDRRPTPAAPWRMTYTMKTLLLRRIA